jgi:hypothetical protein
MVPRWKRLLYKLRPKLRAGEIHAILNDYRGPQIPRKLEVGSEWVALMEQNEGFDDWLKKDKLHCAIHHFVLEEISARQDYPRTDLTSTLPAIRDGRLSLKGLTMPYIRRDKFNSDPNARVVYADLETEI